MTIEPDATVHEAARLISRSKHNRLPVVEHGRLVGVGHARRRARGADPGLTCVRALARVDLGAIERNCARLARVAAPAALCAVVKADGYGHGARAGRARRAGRRRDLARGRHRAARRPRCAPPGSSGPLLVMGALSAEELDGRAARRAPTSSPGARASSRAVAAHPDGDGAGVHVKLDTGMGRLGTRDAAEATRTAARGRRRAAAARSPAR